jgi:hypothetical protein
MGMERPEKMSFFAKSRMFVPGAAAALWLLLAASTAHAQNPNAIYLATFGGADGIGFLPECVSALNGSTYETYPCYDTTGDGQGSVFTSTGQIQTTAFDVSGTAYTYCMAVHNGNPASQIVDSAQCRSGDVSQQWGFSNGRFYPRQWPGNCLTVSGSTGPNQPIGLAPCSSVANAQIFLPLQANLQLKNAATGNCLASFHSRSTAWFASAPCTGTFPQVFYFGLAGTPDDTQAGYKVGLLEGIGGPPGPCVGWNGQIGNRPFPDYNCVNMNYANPSWEFWSVTIGGQLANAFPACLEALDATNVVERGCGLRNHPGQKWVMSLIGIPGW